MGLFDWQRIVLNRMGSVSLDRSKESLGSGHQRLEFASSDQLNSSPLLLKSQTNHRDWIYCIYLLLVICTTVAYLSFKALRAWCDISHQLSTDGTVPLWCHLALVFTASTVNDLSCECGKVNVMHLQPVTDEWFILNAKWNLLCQTVFAQWELGMVNNVFMVCTWLICILNRFTLIMCGWQSCGGITVYFCYLVTVKCDFIISALGMCVYVYACMSVRERELAIAWHAKHNTQEMDYNSPLLFPWQLLQWKDVHGTFRLMAHLYRHLFSSMFTSLAFWPLPNSCSWVSCSVRLTDCHLSTCHSAAEGESRAVRWTVRSKNRWLMFIFISYCCKMCCWKKQNNPV